MASSKISQKRGRSKACHRCKEIRRGCVPSEFDPRTCVNCHEVNVNCSLYPSRATPSKETKRKIEEIGDTPDRESTRSNRATSSATAPYNPNDAPILPPPKKPRYGSRAQLASTKPLVPAEKKRIIPVNACGVCLEKQCDSGEKKGDLEMLKCEIKGCRTWYHLSCLLFKSQDRKIFYSFHTGTKNITFICPNCYNPERVDLANAVKKATSDFEKAMERINQIVTAEKEGWPETFIPSPLQEQNNGRAFERNIESVEIEGPRSTYCEPARQEKFEGYIESSEIEEPRPTYLDRANQEKYEGFETKIINSLLKEIEEAVYDYDREICYSKELFHHGNDISMNNPLRAWDQVDPGQHFVPGKQWFEVDGEANNLSKAHAPITAALRKMLGTHDDKLLSISPDLMDLSFSEVHTAMINWFILDILNNELNIYLLPNMKPLRAMMTAVANFGSARWKDGGRHVLREVQLRAWHKQQFREEVVENVGWQGELIRRLDHFLKPLTKKVGEIDPWSPSRANIIKHTIELWTYLRAAMGKLDVVQPTIGASFDGKTGENINDDVQTGRLQDMEIKWVSRRGFTFREDSLDGSVRPLTKKALVIVG